MQANSPWQKAPLHSTGDASRLTALFLGRIWPICSLVTPCQPGASPVSVRRGVSPRAAKRFASPVEPTRGQRYSPVRLIQQVEAGDPVVLPFPGSVSQFATLVEIDGALEGMARLALVQSDLDSPAQAGVRGPVDHEQGAFHAADFPQGGRQLVLARIGGELAQDLARPHGSRRPWWPPRAGCPPSCRRSGPRSPCRRPAGAGASGRPRGRTHGGVWKAGRGCAGRTRSRGASTRRRHGRGEDQPRQREGRRALRQGRRRERRPSSVRTSPSSVRTARISVSTFPSCFSNSTPIPTAAARTVPMTAFVSRSSRRPRWGVPGLVRGARDPARVPPRPGSPQRASARPESCRG